MISAQQDIIRKELESGTGAAIGMAEDQSGTRTGLRVWFSDLEEQHGPVTELRPYGLRGLIVKLVFGKFAGQVVRKIQSAGPEDVSLARALVASICPSVNLDLSGQSVDNWRVLSGDFTITATARSLPLDPDVATTKVCRDVIVPLMAAMAELIGYDVIENSGLESEGYEGELFESSIRRYERNPRNRLLCIRLHGEKCACCGIEPRSVYGEAGGIIEVHHLEPLSLLAAPRPYDPSVDLVPLCPNCHRAVHMRRPVPLTLSELRALISSTAVSKEAVQ
jgi:5-methylcytosine-specific restriction protein A